MRTDIRTSGSINAFQLENPALGVDFIPTMFRVGVFVALLAVCHDTQAKKNPTTSSTTTTAFFATPPASLGVPADFTAGPFFATDFLKVFFPGFGPTQTSVEPQPLITDPVVSVYHKCARFKPCSMRNLINSQELSSHLILPIPRLFLRRTFRTLLYFLPQM